MRTALLQLTSSDDPAENLATITEMIRQAAADGADLVVTPEVTNCVSLSRRRQEDVLRRQADDPFLAGMQSLASELGITILLGSLALKTEEPRFTNRSFLIGSDGAILARYDKIHMFDVDLGTGEAYRESDGYRPGTRAVTAPLSPFTLGLTICYDLRFPALYRRLAQAGADVLTIPSAFTKPTGAAHWHTLLRARAIECGAYVLAPAQTGLHPATAGGRQRETFGHSLVVDPWGTILLDMGEEPGIGHVTLNPEVTASARKKIPSLAHDAPFDGPDE